MSLESGTYINSLVVTNPTGQDPKAQGPAHMRLIKKTLKNTFPNVSGEVSASASELNMFKIGGTASGNLTVKGDISASSHLIYKLHGSASASDRISIDVDNSLLKVDTGEINTHQDHWSRGYWSASSTTIQNSSATTQFILSLFNANSGKDYTYDNSTFVLPPGRFKIGARYVLSASSSDAVNVKTTLRNNNDLVDVGVIYHEMYQLLGQETIQGVFDVNLSASSTLTIRSLISMPGGSYSVHLGDTISSVYVRKL